MDKTFNNVKEGLSEAAQHCQAMLDVFTLLQQIKVESEENVIDIDD